MTYGTRLWTILLIFTLLIFYTFTHMEFNLVQFLFGTCVLCLSCLNFLLFRLIRAGLGCNDELRNCLDFHY